MEELLRILEQEYKSGERLRARNDPNDFDKAYQTFHDQNFPKAEFLFSEILRYKGGVKESADISVARVAAWLACTLLKQNQHAAAHVLLVGINESHESYQNSYGANKKSDVHFFQMVLYALGCVDLEKAKTPHGIVDHHYLQQALHWLEKNLEIRRYWFGIHDSSTIATSFRLGSARYLNKEYGETHLHLAGIVSYLARSQQISDDLRYGCRLWLGCNYYMMGDYHNAETHLKNVPLDYNELVLNHQEKQAWSLRIWYATTLYKQKKYSEAEQIYHDALHQLLENGSCFAISKDGRQTLTPLASRTTTQLANSVHKQAEFQTGHSNFLDIIDTNTAHLPSQVGKLLQNLYAGAVFEAMFASALEAYASKDFQTALGICQNALAWHGDKLTSQDTDVTPVNSLINSISLITADSLVNQKDKDKDTLPEVVTHDHPRLTDLIEHARQYSTEGTGPLNNIGSSKDEEDNQSAANAEELPHEAGPRRHGGRIGRAIGQIGRLLRQNGNTDADTTTRVGSPQHPNTTGGSSSAYDRSKLLPAIPARPANDNYDTNGYAAGSRRQDHEQVMHPPIAELPASYPSVELDASSRSIVKNSTLATNDQNAPSSFMRLLDSLTKDNLETKPSVKERSSSLCTATGYFVPSIVPSIHSATQSLDGFDEKSSSKDPTGNAPDEQISVPESTPHDASEEIPIPENEQTWPSRDDGVPIRNISAPAELSGISRQNPTHVTTTFTSSAQSDNSEDEQRELTIMPQGIASVTNSSVLASRASQASMYESPRTSITSGNVETNLEAFFEQRSYQEHTMLENTFTEAEILKISLLLKAHRPVWSTVPRTYIVLRTIQCLQHIDMIIKSGFSDYELPVSDRNVPACLDAEKRLGFLAAQKLVLSRDVNLEQGGLGKHHHFGIDDSFPFEFEERLGAGGFGEVDQVKSLKTQKRYALKRVRRKAVSTSKGLAGMRGIIAEIEILKTLNHKHKHIVDFVGSFTDAKFLGLIMTPVADMDLAEYLLQAQPAQYPLLRSFFGCLTTGLRFLHDKSIRHKDIKLQNILVHKQNVLLTDFGLARDFADATGSTSVGTINGTSPRYCAPEVLLMESRNTKSDIWGLGVVFLEMLVALKGKNNEWMDDFMLSHGMEHRFVRTNPEGCQELMEELRRTGTKSDNVILDWVNLMLKVQHTRRPTAASLLEIMLESEASDGRFCGLCCRFIDDSSDEDD